MSWRNVSNAPLYGNGGGIQQAVANPGVWSGIGKAGSTIANAMMASAEEEVQEGTDETMDYSSLEGSEYNPAEYDALVKERNQDPYYEEGWEDEWQNGGMIPQYRGGGWTSGDAVQGKPNQEDPWASYGQNDDEWDPTKAYSNPSILDTIKRSAKGLDKKDGTGFWNKMDIDNAIGAAFGVGKVGLGAIGAVGQGISKYNTGVQNKIKARDTARREEGYKRQQAMIDRKEQLKTQAGQQGAEHTDQQLKREQFMALKDQERLGTKGVTDPMYQGLEKVVQDRKVGRLQNKIDATEADIHNILDPSKSSLSSEQRQMLQTIKANQQKADTDFSASMEGKTAEELGAMFPLDADATVGGDNAEVNKFYQQKQIHDAAMAGHVREAGDMPRPTKEMYRHGPRVIDYDNPEVKQKYNESKDAFLSSREDDPEFAGQIAEFEERVRLRNLKEDDPDRYRREMMKSAGFTEEEINKDMNPQKHNFNIPPVPGETDPLLPLGKKTKKTSMRHQSLGPGETDWKGNPVGSTQVSDSEGLAMTIPGVSESDIDEIKFWQDESTAMQGEHAKTTKTLEELEAKQNKGRNLGQENLKALHTKERDFQLNNAMNLQGYTQQQTGTGLSHLQTGRNEPTEGGQSRRGFSGLRGKVSGWLDKIKGSFETGGYLAPRRQRSYSMGGDLAQANRQQEQGSQKMLMAGQQSDGQITDDTIRHNRMKVFIAELNQQSPMFIDTILQR